MEGKQNLYNIEQQSQTKKKLKSEDKSIKRDIVQIALEDFEQLILSFLEKVEILKKKLYKEFQIYNEIQKIEDNNEKKQQLDKEIAILYHENQHQLGNLTQFLNREMYQIKKKSGYSQIIQDYYKQQEKDQEELKKINKSFEIYSESIKIETQYIESLFKKEQDLSDTDFNTILIYKIGRFIGHNNEWSFRKDYFIDKVVLFDIFRTFSINKKEQRLAFLFELYIRHKENIKNNHKCLFSYLQESFLNILDTRLTHPCPSYISADQNYFKVLGQQLNYNKTRQQQTNLLDIVWGILNSFDENCITYYSTQLNKYNSLQFKLASEYAKKIIIANEFEQTISVINQELKIRNVTSKQIEDSFENMINNSVSYVEVPESSPSHGFQTINGMIGININKYSEISITWNQNEEEKYNNNYRNILCKKDQIDKTFSLVLTLVHEFLHYYRFKYYSKYNIFKRTPQGLKGINQSPEIGQFYEQQLGFSSINEANYILTLESVVMNMKKDIQKVWNKEYFNLVIEKQRQLNKQNSTMYEQKINDTVKFHNLRIQSPQKSIMQERRCPITSVNWYQE